MKFILYVFTLWLSILFAQAQMVEPCVTTHVLEYHKLFNSDDKRNIEDAIINASNWKNTQITSLNEVVIPVVVHVVYLKEEENIADEVIQSQIESLNKSYKNTGITFCLASVDPRGSFTSGITHTRGYGALNGIFNFYDPLKQTVKYTNQGGEDAWPDTQYLNIWICNLLPGVDAYAQMPGDDKTSDGVVINSNLFSSDIMGHQIAHWLGINAEACKTEKTFDSFSTEEIATMQSYLYTDKQSLLQSNTSYCQQQMVSSINESIDNSREEEILLYPNPINDEINIEVKNSDLKQLSIINSVGQVLWQNAIYSNSRFAINFSTFPSGIYYLKTNAFVTKFMKL